MPKDKVKILVYVYGTLRKGQYNFDRINNNFGSDSIKKVSERVIEGFKMYTIHDWYPAVVYTGRPEDKIVVEEVKVTPEAKTFIDRMEAGAGYTIKQVDGLDIYCMLEDDMDDGLTGVIESGDWVKYIESK